MILSTHDEYLSHLSSQFTSHADDRPFWEALGTYTEELSCLLDLSLDPVREALNALYCPTGQGDPLDPVGLLRSWLVMALCREGSPTVWARRLRREPVLAVLAGYRPGNTPGASTHRDFLVRLADGPYAVRRVQDVPYSQQFTGRHHRRLADATKARREAADAAGMQQSELLSEVLLTQAAQPQNPYNLQGRLEFLFVQLGLNPTIAANLLPTELTVSGDGTVEVSAASKQGHRACNCPAGSRCGCARDYLSKTAQFCHDRQHGWRFGDRSYTISLHINHRDIPLMTILPGGNESDFTLSLTALDRLLSLLEMQDLPLRIGIFLGDGHHDSMGIYRYLKAKGIVPIIPLGESSHPVSAPTSASHANTGTDTPAVPTATKTTAKTGTKTTTPRPQVEAYPHLTFEPDGTPLCPDGCRMRHHGYLKARAAHTFVCPAMHINGAGEWHFRANECPRHERCTPEEKTMGLTYYIKSEADLRLFPPIPRDSTRFKELFAHRSGIERENASTDSYHLDRRHRNPALVLIRLTLINIVKHARLRDAERHATGGKNARMHAALQQLDLSALLPT